MSAALDELVDTLLYEGYALYPFTSDAVPTPFGIVYPPAYAAGRPSVFAHLRLECAVRAPERAELDVSIRFLQAESVRHGTRERAVRPGPVTLGALDEPLGRTFVFPGLVGRVWTVIERVAPGLARLCVRFENTTALDPAVARGMDRTAALRRSFLSTHVLLRLSAGRFVSPLETDGADGRVAQGCRNENVWPVLATPADDTVLGAAVILPDHPSLARRAGDHLDGTETEEALLPQLDVLSDGERRTIAAADDEAVRRMIERTSRIGAAELDALHGEMHPVEPRGAPAPCTGRDEVEAGGVVLRRGARVALRLVGGRDPYAALLDGRTAVIERIDVGRDDRAYLGVRVEDDPGRELQRASGRLLYLFPNEVEVLEP